MPRIETEVKINASAEEVWQELTDFESYADWNTFVTYNGGEPQQGKKLSLRITPPSGMAMSFKPRVTARIENRKFEWLGTLLVPGIMDGRHTFEIEEVDGGVKLRHYESFRGILAHPMGWFGVYRNTRPGFELMNQQLKKRVEEKVGSKQS